MKQQLDIVFETAYHKAVHRSNKPGNTWTPWLDFTDEHLEERLLEEIKEYFEKNEARELIDIINIAAYLFLRKTIHKDTILPVPK